MSGSRAIVLSLSVRDADVVRQQLVQMGAQGEAALSRLDAAAQRAAGRGGAGGGGVQGLAAANDTAAASTGRFSNMIGQAGFQIGDFASQVQSGGSALTAFSQQASQFLGVFGTGGAVAGAVLTVGILAASFIGLGNDAEEAGRKAEDAARDVKTAQDSLAEAVRVVNGLLLSQEQQARAAANAQIEATAASLTRQRDLTQSSIGGFAIERDRAIADAERFERQLAAERARNERIRRGGGMVATDAEAELERRAREARAAAQVAIIAQGEARGRLQEIDGTISQLGVGALLARLRAEVADEDPPPSNDNGRGGATRPGMDVASVVQQRIDDLTRSYDAYNQALNLSEAGLDSAAGALQRYGEQQALLTQLLDAGIITEAQFAEEVERSSVALGRQLDQIEQRGQRAGQAANQLGFSFASAFEDAIIKGSSLSDVLKGLEQDIARIIIRSAITQPLGNAIAQGVTNMLPFGGPRAEGGPINAGMAYLVGERGPEIVVPRSAGTVVPNHALGGVTFAPTYNIDARGADVSVVPRLRTEMAAIARAANAELLAEIQRGGAAARIVGRRA